MPIPDKAKNDCIAILSLEEYAEQVSMIEKIREEYGPDQVLDILTLTCSLLSYIDDFEERAKALYIKSRGNYRKRAFMRMLLGNDDYGRDPIHKEYFDRLETEIKSVEAQLNGLDPAYSDISEAISKTLTEKLLEDTDPETQPHLYLDFSADDIFVYDLLPFLSSQSLQSIYSSYTADKKSSDLFPNQKKLIRRMKELINS